MAHLTEEQVARIHTEEKGDVLVNVEVRLHESVVCVREYMWRRIDADEGA